MIWTVTRGDGRDAVKLLDAAYWVKGCSSLGKLRYAALIRVGKKKDKRYRLMDIKEAVKPEAPSSPTDEMPSNNSERVIMGARHLSPFLGERMAGALLGDPCFPRRERRMRSKPPDDWFRPDFAEAERSFVHSHPMRKLPHRGCSFSWKAGRPPSTTSGKRA